MRNNRSRSGSAMNRKFDAIVKEMKEKLDAIITNKDCPKVTITNKKSKIGSLRKTEPIECAARIIIGGKKGDTINTFNVEIPKESENTIFKAKIPNAGHVTLQMPPYTKTKRFESVLPHTTTDISFNTVINGSPCGIEIPVIDDTGRPGHKSK